MTILLGSTIFQKAICFDCFISVRKIKVLLSSLKCKFLNTQLVCIFSFKQTYLEHGCKSVSIFHINAFDCHCQIFCVIFNNGSGKEKPQATSGF